MNREKLEQLYQEGRYQEAWWAYTALAAKGEASAEVHLKGAQAARDQGHLHSALYAIEQALPLAEGVVGGKVRFTYAGLLILLGRFEEAISEFERWIADLHHYPELGPTHLAAAHFNLGLTCRHIRRYADSVSHYQAAIEHAQANGQMRYRCLALLNLAWVACLCGDEGMAAQALHEAEPLAETHELRWHHLVGKAFLQAVSKDGDLHHVMRLCQEIIEYQGEDLPLSVRSHAYWLSGRVALELSLGDTARVMAEQALWFGAAAGDDRCMSDAARLIREIDHRLATTV